MVGELFRVSAGAGGGSGAGDADRAEDSCTEGTGIFRIEGSKTSFGLNATMYPNRKIFEARKRETAALGAGEKLVLGHPLAAHYR